jgi:osmotically-inducible protein OsmY
MSHDSQLQQSVLAELKWEPSVIAAHIGVTADAGVVTLTGHVDSFAQKHAAEQAAGRVKGVKGIAQEIEVQLPFDKKRTDDEIAAAAIDRLAWDVSIPADAIQVEVDAGWVTLTGEVNWYYEKESAEDNIRKLFGVIGVSNQITIKAQVNASNISNDIAHALHRSWFFEPKAIKVKAVDGKVTLTGNVKSYHDWDVATSIAWSAPGTTGVQNDIVIDDEQNQTRSFERTQEDRDAEEPANSSRSA